MGADRRAATPAANTADRPCLYRIDAATWRVEQEFVFEKEEYPSELCINGAGDVLYFINDGICKMSVTAAHAPVRPLIPNERRHQIYGLAVDPTSGEIYVGDAIDFEQPGVVYRYRDTGQSANWSTRSAWECYPAPSHSNRKPP